MVKLMKMERRHIHLIMEYLGTHICQVIGFLKPMELKNERLSTSLFKEKLVIYT